MYVNLALVDFRVREFITIKDPYWMNQNQSLLMVGEAEVAAVVVVARGCAQLSLVHIPG